MKISLLVEGKYEEQKRPLKGNGNSRNADRVVLRGAFKDFLSQTGIVLDVETKGGIGEVYKAFLEQFENPNRLADEQILMLVDSDKPLQDIPQRADATYDYWQAVLHNPANLNPKPLPVGVTANQVFLMVSEMEAWLVTDTANLQAHYNLAEAPALLDEIENTPKEDVIDYLNDLAQKSKRRNYHKIYDGAELLRNTKAANACKLSQCNRLFQELKRLSAPH